MVYGYLQYGTKFQAFSDVSVVAKLVLEVIRVSTNNDDCWA